MVKFATRLKELRLEKGLTQTQLATEMQVHQTTVKDWEVQGNETSFEMLIRLANFFQVSTDFLLGVSDE